MSVDPGPPMLSTQAERALCWIERLVELGLPRSSFQVSFPGKRNDSTLVDGVTLLEACVESLHRRNLDRFPAALQIDGKILWDVWRRYPLSETLEVIGRMGRREFATVESLGEGLETYGRLLEELQHYDDSIAPGLLLWCRELVGAWPFAAAATGRQLRLGAASQPVMQSPPVAPRSILGRMVAAYRRPAPAGGPVWCIIPTLELVRQRRSGEQGTKCCGMLAGMGGCPSPGRTTLMRLPRRVAKSTSMLGVCIAGVGEIDPEVAATTVALYEGGMDAPAALQAAQLIEV